MYGTGHAVVCVPIGWLVTGLRAADLFDNTCFFELRIHVQSESRCLLLTLGWTAVCIIMFVAVLTNDCFWKERCVWIDFPIIKWAGSNLHIFLEVSLCLAISVCAVVMLQDSQFVISLALLNFALHISKCADSMLWGYIIAGMYTKGPSNWLQSPTKHLSQ